MALIERYILRRIAGTFLLVLLTLVATVWVTQVLRELDVVTSKGQTIGLFLWMTLLVIPSIVPVIAPFALLVAVLWTLNAMNADSETAIISASGASKARIVRPVLLFAAGIALFSSVFYHVLAPAGLSSLRVLVTQVRADLIATVVKDGGFRTVEDGLTLHIREKAGDGTFRDLFVSDDREDDESRQYTARQGLLIGSADSTYLVMRAGSIVRKDKRSGAINIINFDTYAFDLSQFRKAESVTYFKPRERTSGYLLSPDADDAFFQSSPQRFASELHERLSAPLYCFAFALIVLAYAASPRTSRQDRGFAAAVPAIACLLLRALGFFAFGFVDKAAGLAPLLHIVPLLGIAGGALLLAFDIRLAMPRVVERLIGLVHALVGALRPGRRHAALGLGA